jgi:ATP-dependent protease ClpP protease subunit
MKNTERLMEKGIYTLLNVNHEEVNLIGKWIAKSRPERKEFTLLIDSCGGSPSAALSFASYIGILEKDVVIKGVTVNECGSAAMAILQCCHERIAVKNTAFFIHHIVTSFSMSCYNPDFDEIERQFDESRRLEEELIKIQIQRSNMDREKWMELADRGSKHSSTPIFTHEALSLNLVDKIVDSFHCI